MGGDVAAMREGLKANLSTIEGLRTRDFVPDQAEPPMAVVFPRTPQFGFQETMDSDTNPGMWRWPFTIFVVAGRADTRKAQEVLDAYVSTVGDRSIKRAVYTDRTLAGAAAFVRYEGCSDYSLATQIGGVDYAVADIDVTAWSE